MRMTEFLAYINEDIPDGYTFSHLDLTALKKNKKIKALKRDIKKMKKDSQKRETDDIDLFEKE